MSKPSSSQETATSQTHWGFSDEELANYPLVYREDLFANQTVVVSGGGSGIGKAIAFLFARLGANVAICGRTASKLEHTQTAIKRHVGSAIHTMEMNIRQPDLVDTFLDQVCERFGGIDFLINNAGGQFPQPAIDFSANGWNAVIDTNLNGTWYMMQNAAKRWRDEKRGGSIVNVVANVQRGMPQVAHTCAARAGVIYLSKSVSTEWAPLGIRVNCVSPGAIESEGFHVYHPDVAERFKDSNPMRTLGDVYDIAQSIAYICAPSGKFITGEVITVDGGNNQWGDTWPGGVPEHFKVT